MSTPKKTAVLKNQGAIEYSLNYLMARLGKYK